jgi:hypothetical protein
MAAWTMPRIFVVDQGRPPGFCSNAITVLQEREVHEADHVHASGNPPSVYELVLGLRFGDRDDAGG